jgi:hypothetical protein
VREHHRVAEAPTATSLGGGEHLDRHRGEVVEVLVHVGTPSEVHLGDRVETVALVGVEQGRHLDPVAHRHRQALEQAAADRPLAGERLHDRGQLGPVQREPRPGDQLGDAPALGRHARAHVEDAVVEALGEEHLAIGEQRSDQPGDEVRAPLGQVGVDEDEEVGRRHEQRLPQRLALAPAHPEVGADLGDGAHPCPRRGGDRRRRVVRQGVHDDQLVDECAEIRADLADDVADRRLLVAGGDDDRDGRRLLRRQHLLERPVAGRRGAAVPPLACGGVHHAGRSWRIWSGRR